MPLIARRPCLVDLAHVEELLERSKLQREAATVVAVDDVDGVVHFAVGAIVPHATVHANGWVRGYAKG